MVIGGVGGGGAAMMGVRPGGAGDIKGEGDGNEMVLKGLCWGVGGAVAG